MTYCIWFICRDQRSTSFSNVLSFNFYAGSRNKTQVGRFVQQVPLPNLDSLIIEIPNWVLVYQLSSIEYGIQHDLVY